VALYSSLGSHPAALKYTRLTDFTDSALAPALSPDGHMVAFIRGGSSFLTADQIYVKVLPNGEARRLTDDPQDRGIAGVEIYKLNADSNAIEHWDVLQEITDPKKAADVRRAV